MVERSFDLKFETFSNKIARPPVLSAWHKRCRHPFCSSSPIFCIDCTKRGRTLSPKTAGVTDETSSSRRPSDPPNAVSKFSTGFIYLFSGWQLPIFFSAWPARGGSGKKRWPAPGPLRRVDRSSIPISFDRHVVWRTSRDIFRRKIKIWNCERNLWNVIINFEFLSEKKKKNKKILKNKIKKVFLVWKCKITETRIIQNKVVQKLKEFQVFNSVQKVKK